MHRTLFSLTLSRAKCQALAIPGITRQILEYSAYRQATRCDVARTSLRIMSNRPIFKWTHQYVIDQPTVIQRLLIVAIRANNINAFNALIHAGASPHGSGNVTPLYVAAYVGAIRIVHALLAMDVSPNVHTKVHKVTPLMVAAQQGHTHVMRALIAKGADPNKTDTRGQTARMMMKTNQYDY